MSVFNLTQVPVTTQNELEKRTKTAGIVWASERSPWFNLISMCEACKANQEDEIGIASWGYKSGYQRPEITVTQIQIKKQGELGTTRKAIVTMKAYTDDDLIRLQKCFFIPGMSVRLQWGWSESCLGNPPPGLVTDRGLTDNDANCQIKTKTDQSPVYDGLQGLVANFNYSLDADGNWDCTLEIIAPSSVGLDTKVQYACCEKCKTSVSDTSLLSDILRTFNVNESPDPKDYEQNKGALFGALLKLADNQDAAIQQNNIKKLINKIRSYGYDQADSMIYYYEGADRLPSGGDDQSFWSFGNYGTSESYITWHMLEGMVTLFSFPSDNNGKASLANIKTSDPVEIVYPKGNYWVESADPRICLLPGSPAFEGTGGVSGPMHDNNGDLYRHDIVGKAVRTSGGRYIVSWRSIMINTTFLLTELDATLQADGTVDTFLRSVMRKVNECIGSVASLDIIALDAAGCATSKDTPSTLSLIELKQNQTSVAPYIIKATPGDSSTRNVTLDLKLTEAMKAQALYSNADGGGQTDNTCNANSDPCTNYAFKPFTLAKNSTSQNRAARTASMSKACKDCEDLGSKVPAKPATAYVEYVNNLIDVVSDEICDALKTKQIKEIRDATVADANTTCKDVMLPFNFSFTVDGVSGFRWGQAVTCNRIPSAVRLGFTWQITAVEHTLTHNDWTTTVQTVARWTGK
jgi:hypothetical protein